MMNRMLMISNDQHFMIDPHLVKRIVLYAELTKNDIVLEIGAGTGNLTKEIVKKSRVIAVEKDKRFEELLKNIVNGNGKVILGDILKINFRGLEFNKIISNIPFSITEPLFKQLILLDFELAILTIGENFYKIIVDETSKMHHLLKSKFDLQKQEDIPKHCFEPIPRTDAVLIKMLKKKNKSKEEEIISKLIDLHKKKIKNSLLEIILNQNKTKKQAKLFLDEHKEKFLEKGIFSISNKDFLKLLEIIKLI